MTPPADSTRANGQYCGWNERADEYGPLENAWQRVEPGIKVVTTRVPKRAAQSGVRSPAQSLADVYADVGEWWRIAPWRKARAR